MINKKNKLCIDDTLYDTEINESHLKPSGKTIPDPREVKAVIPGTVVEVMVRKGQFVTKGQVILMLEAMKMLNKIEAEMDGKIEEINVSAGNRVEKDKVMIRVADLYVEANDIENAKETLKLVEEVFPYNDETQIIVKEKLKNMN